MTITTQGLWWFYDRIGENMSQGNGHFRWEMLFFKVSSQKHHKLM